GDPTPLTDTATVVFTLAQTLGTFPNQITGSATNSVNLSRPAPTVQVDSAVVNGADGAALGGTDPASNQRSKVNSVVVTFTGTVTLDAGAIQVLKYAGSTPTTAQGLVITTSAVVLNGVQVTQATIRFTGGGIVGGSLSDGNYRLLVDHT